MRTKIGIVYDMITGEVRRIIIPDEDHQLAAHANVALDEVLHTETQTGLIDLIEIHAIMQRVTGKMLP